MVCPYTYVSNNYNFILSSKKRSKSIKYTKSVFNLVQVLYRSGIISSFTLFTNYKKQLLISITIFFYKNVPFFKKINTISTLSKKFYISKSTLSLSKLVFKSSLILLSTSAGVINHKEALKIGVGGVLVYIVH